MAARNRILKGILIAAGALAGIVVLAIILLVVFFPTERIRAFAEAQAETYIDRPVTIGNIGVAFWPYLGARIDGVTIGNDPELTSEPLFSLGRIVVSVDLWKLITHRELRIREVLIDKPRATVIIDEDGRSSLDGLFVEQPEIEVDTTEQVMGIPIALLVDRFRISDARIHYLDKQSDTELLIDGLSERSPSQSTLRPRRSPSTASLSLRALPSARKGRALAQRGSKSGIAHSWMFPPTQRHSASISRWRAFR